MKAKTSLRKALGDSALLAGAIAGESWGAWRTLLIAAMGEPLTDAELPIFTKLTGREVAPLQRVEELMAVVGRRGGKSRSMATLAAYLAGLCDHHDALAPGETGKLLCIAPDQRQAKIVLDYTEAAFQGSPILRQLLVNRTADQLELENRIVVEVRAASFRRLRGSTYIAVIADESAFWISDEGSANPDTEILNAVRPGLATTGGPLVIASSPYARRGVLWETYKRHYGAEGDSRILVAQGTTRDFNPSLPQAVVDRALERDRASASAEYLAQFRTDIEGFVSHEVVQGCIGEHVENGPVVGPKYYGFVDPSGGSADSFTLAISHKQDDSIIIDAIRETHPPFSPESTIHDFAALLQSYRVSNVVGDRYAGEFPRELFRNRGIQYECAAKPKSDLFRDFLPLLNSGRVLLPKSERLVNQLVGLERRTTRGGRDSIDHGPGGHDDLANCVAGAADLIANQREVPTARFGHYSWG